MEKWGRLFKKGKGNLAPGMLGFLGGFPRDCVLGEGLVLREGRLGC